MRSRSVRGWRRRAGLDAGGEHERLETREPVAGELAWIVVSEPSWPVFMAWSMSTVSAPPDLTHDDAVGAHARGVAHELANADLTGALDVRRARFQGDHVILLELAQRRLRSSRCARPRGRRPTSRSAASSCRCRYRRR